MDSLNAAATHGRYSVARLIAPDELRRFEAFNKEISDKDSTLSPNTQSSELKTKETLKTNEALKSKEALIRISYT